MTEFKIDKRTIKDIRTQIRSLAAHYTPEWVFDENNPDIGSVIALIFANQLYENITKLNTAIDNYHVEFVNMLHLGILPAHPAKGVVTMSLANTVSGIDIPKATKLLGNSADEEDSQILFETMTDIHITNSKISNIIAISGHFGSIIPIFGEWENSDLFPIQQIEELPQPMVLEELEPIGLFDFTKKGVAEYKAVFYHRSMFDTNSESSISVLLKNTNTYEEGFAKKFTDTSKYQWSYYSETGLQAFDSVKEENGIINLFKYGQCSKITVDGDEYNAILLEAKKAPLEEIFVNEVRIASKCNKILPEYALHNSEDLDVLKFMPFGEAASLFDECYIGSDSIFQQSGANVTMNFQLSYSEKLWSFTQEQEEKELKVIKKKPKGLSVQIANTATERVAFEYYNGVGWKRLLLLRDSATVFDGQFLGEVNIEFICPDDWKAIVMGGYEQRAVRMRVTQADHCYLQPCIHNMPVISNMTLSYSYYGQFGFPHKMKTKNGSRIVDVSEKVLNGRAFSLFAPLQYGQNALYLGFDKRMDGAPISILFDISEGQKNRTIPVFFEYTSPTGWERLKLIDHTENMTRSGTVLFVPPSDFSAYSIEGVSRYWIRLLDAFGHYNDATKGHSAIMRIIPNVVEVCNVETLEEEEFYIDNLRPNMSFPMSARNILEAEIFVNEVKSFSAAMQKQLLTEQAENIKASRNFLGEINEFFMRWKEVPNFDNSKPTDRHIVIDRMDNTIHFGDGVSVMIPKSGNDVAFTAQAKCCDGEKGNLPEGSITAAYGRLLYIEDINNPIATFGGSNMESVENALKRGTNMFNSKNRFVSRFDFVREVLSVSTAILKVKCINGSDVFMGSIPSLLTIVVMMKDYADGPYSFQSIKDELRERLLEKSEVMLLPEDLILCEPVYVEISVEVWIRPAKIEELFETQNMIKDNISTFIDPAHSHNGVGWEIGTIPTELQLEMLLKSMNSDFQLYYIVATAKYVDKEDIRECELKRLPKNPAMIGINGQHKIHTLFPK